MRSLIHKTRQTWEVVSCARAIAEGLSFAYRAPVKMDVVKDERSPLSPHKSDRLMDK